MDIKTKMLIYYYALILYQSGKEVEEKYKIYLQNNKNKDNEAYLHASFMYSIDVITLWSNKLSNLQEELKELHKICKMTHTYRHLKDFEECLLLNKEFYNEARQIFKKEIKKIDWSNISSKESLIWNKQCPEINEYLYQLLLEEGILIH